MSYHTNFTGILALMTSCVPNVAYMCRSPDHNEKTIGSLRIRLYIIIFLLVLTCMCRTFFAIAAHDCDLMRANHRHHGINRILPH